MARHPHLFADFEAAEFGPLINQIARFEDSLRILLDRHEHAAGRSRVVLLSLLKRIRRATDAVDELPE